MITITELRQAMIGGAKIILRRLMESSGRGSRVSRRTVLQSLMLATAMLAACDVTPPALERQQISGKITSLRAQEVNGTANSSSDSSAFHMLVGIDTAPNLMLAFNLHEPPQHGMVDLLSEALAGDRTAIIDYTELKAGVGLIVGVSLINEAATPFVLVREVANIVVAANDPKQISGVLDPSVLTNAPPAPPAFQNKGAHELFEETLWAPITQAELQPGDSKQLSVTITEPSLLLASITWRGSAMPVSVQVVRGGATLVDGVAFAVPPDHGTVLADAKLGTPGDATVVVSNPGATTVNIQIVVGTVPLTLGGVSP
jgi:hypothetical protein